MIGYLEGVIRQESAEGVLLLAAGVGYQVLIQPAALEKARSLSPDPDKTGLYIYHHQTERQPKPVLIGFATPEDKSFFQVFITVDAIGPMKAIKALSRSSSRIAWAIENKDINFLTRLNGIGKRTAQKIIATLRGKVEKFIAEGEGEFQAESRQEGRMTQPAALQVLDVLVSRLGHSPASAKALIKRALDRNKTIRTPEALMDEIYREDHPT